MSTIEPHRADVTLPDDRRVVITRLFDAPRDLVWQAWTEPQHVTRWWFPAGFAVTDCEIDLRVGGVFNHFVRAPDGSVYPCTATFREIVRPERIVYDGTPDDRNAGGAGMPPRAEVRVTFAEEGGRTRLTIETCFDTAAARAAADESGYSTHWPKGLEQLAAHLRDMQA